MLAFEQAASELDVSWGQGRSAFVVLGVQVSFRHHGAGLHEIVRQAWIFELSEVSELKEYFAAARSICEELGGSFLKRHDLSSWQTLNIHGALHRNHATPEAASRAINHASVAFAALSAWGCGPTGAGAVHTSNLAWSTSELKRFLEVAELNRSTHSAPGRRAGPRL